MSPGIDPMIVKQTLRNLDTGQMIAGRSARARANQGSATISVVIPVYNEKENIAPLSKELVPVLDMCCQSWEVIWVNDGSTDGTDRELMALCRRESGFRVLTLPSNCGQSAALWCGFQKARGEVVVSLDGDLQNDPRDIPVLLDALESADHVVGWRQHRRDGWTKRVASRVANTVRDWIVRDQIPDTGCSLKAYRRAVIESFVPFHGMHRFYPALALQAGFRVRVVPVNHRRRLHGRAKYGIWNRLVGPLADCLAVLWMKHRLIRSIPCEESVDVCSSESAI